MAPRFRNRLLVYSIFSMIFGGVCAQPLEDAESAGEKSPRAEYQRDIAYGSQNEQKLDLCFNPKAPPGARPGLILIHGGGWTHGSKTVMATVCKNFASMGYIVANVEYRLANRTDQLSRWPGQLADVQLAVRWLRHNAKMLGLDAKRICAMGNSAGGQLAMFLGMMDAPARGAAEGSSLSQYSSKVQCVISLSGPTDLATIGAQFQNVISGPLFGGVRPEENISLYKAASPLYSVSKKAAPMLLIYGTQDNIVPISQGLALASSLQEHGVNARLLQYNGGHLMIGINMKERQEIFQAMVQFLREHLGPIGN
ncbi:MAG: alpha/beta hydrolase [Methylocystis sp.]|uniref:alpha/beta hydrolase fold domain-containing protein n=1 Tax=Methylocystis sp. TaxID=1911079 RepID=UPI0039515B07